ncbi:hypothetical protein KGP36_05085 [Patescibacteria group bacterium]|nr:hypothetical protein [Patescibacteria group bacterium]
MAKKMMVKISKNRKERTVSVSFDADRFERVAADFGLFSRSFIKSLDQAEKDIKSGKITPIKNLSELR